MAIFGVSGDCGYSKRELKEIQKFSDNISSLRRDVYKERFSTHYYPRSSYSFWDYYTPWYNPCCCNNNYFYSPTRSYCYYSDRNREDHDDSSAVIIGIIISVISLGFLGMHFNRSNNYSRLSKELSSINKLARKNVNDPQDRKIKKALRQVIQDGNDFYYNKRIVRKSYKTAGIGGVVTGALYLSSPWIKSCFNQSSILKTANMIGVASLVLVTFGFVYDCFTSDSDASDYNNSQLKHSVRWLKNELWTGYNPLLGDIVKVTTAPFLFF